MSRPTPVSVFLSEQEWFVSVVCGILLPCCKNVIITGAPLYCGGDVTSESGVLTSPNFPSIYGIGEYCIWNLVLPDDGAFGIELRLLAFRTNANDQLSVSNQTETSVPYILEGDLVLETVAFRGSAFQLIFQSFGGADFLAKPQGFKIEWIAVYGKFHCFLLSIYSLHEHSKTGGADHSYRS